MPAATRRWCAGRDHLQLVRLAGLEDGVPHVLGVQGGVAQVDLVALLTGEPGLGDDHRAAGHGAFHQPVGGQLGQLGAEQVDHQVDRLGALDLHGADVDLGDLHVEPLARR